MHKTSARINDIWNVAVALDYIRLDQGFRQATDHLCGVVPIEQEGSDAVFSHRPDPVADDEPAGFGLDRRAAVA